MKLYDVPRNSYVKLLEDAHIPPDSLDVNQSNIIKFINLDGMYSYCKDKEGNVVHIAAWSEVEIVEGFE